MQGEKRNRNCFLGKIWVLWCRKLNHTEKHGNAMAGIVSLDSRFWELFHAPLSHSASVETDGEKQSCSPFITAIFIKEISDLMEVCFSHQNISLGPKYNRGETGKCGNSVPLSDNFLIQHILLLQNYLADTRISWIIRSSDKVVIFKTLY